jgi:hypothetical protein
MKTIQRHPQEAYGIITGLHNSFKITVNSDDDDDDEDEEEHEKQSC